MIDHCQLIAKLGGILCFAVLMACSSTDQAQAPSRQESPPAQPSQAGSDSSITSIETKVVPVNCAITPFPLKPGGLRFQMEQNTRSDMEYFKPIGDGKFGPNGSLYLTFPKKHAVVRFTQPHYDLEFFGEEQAGGRNEPIANPSTLAFWDGKIWVTNTDKGQVMVFSHDFELETLHQIQIQDPIPGPNQNFLIRSDQKPDLFFRSDEKNKIRSQYMVPKNAELDPAMQVLLFDIQPNWDMVAVNRGGTDLFHLSIKGHIKRSFRFDYPQSLGWTALEVADSQFLGDAYWLLIHSIQQGEPKCWLLQVTIDGDCRSLWQLPFIANGFDVNQDRLVLFHKELGKAQVFLR